MIHTTTDQMVRIGEIIVSDSQAAERLVTVGLGSCIGVALVDERTGAAGLAHVFLPEPPPSGVKPGSGRGTYATLAVPALADAVVAAARAPSSRSTLVAILVGGATMFGTRPGQDVGERNLAAVRAQLERLRIATVVSDVGGTRGRTMWVQAGPHPSVAVREVSGTRREMWSAVARVPAARLVEPAARVVEPAARSAEPAALRRVA